MLQPYLRLFAGLCFALFSLAGAAQGLVINEVCAANLGEDIDPSYNFGGWIEIYNPTAHEISLNGMSVADNKGHRHNLTKSHGAVPAHGYRNLWFGHNSQSYPTQIAFNLDTDGGTIALLDGSDASTAGVLDAVTYPAAIGRTSWARTADGGDAWNYCAWPTAEGANDGAQFAAETLGAPMPDHPGGWIDGTTDFSVGVDDGAALYYTTDGRVPTLKSPRATLDAEGRAHFSVTRNTVYRFRAIADGHLPSPVVTRSFITRSYTKTVTDDWDDWGWGNWGGWGPSTHEETTTFGGFSLLSLVTDPDFLYDDTIGLYVEGTNGGWSYWRYANYYQDWSRPVHVEIFDPEGLPLVSQEADMSMSGGYSRMNTPKSFKVKSAKKYGSAFFPATDIFADKPYTRYKHLLVRVGGTTMTDRHQDNLLQQMAACSGLRIDCQAYRPVYVFFNGEYQETLLLREPSNAQYGYSNYGMDTDFMDALEESDITGVTLSTGSWDAFGQLYDAAAACGKNDEAWERVQQLLDVDEYANYFALETYLANEDWPQNNIKMFRSSADDPEAPGPFRVVLQDLDACFHETGNTFERMEQFTVYPYAVAGRQENVLLTIFLNLMGREEFRQRFVDAYCLMAGSVFSPAAAASETSRLYNILAEGYVEQLSSVRNALSGLQNQLGSSWQQKRIKYLQQWGRARLNGARSVTVSISASSDDVALLLNGQPIPRHQFSGTLFLPVTLEAKAPEGKVFEGWTLDGKTIATTETLQLSQGGNYCAVYTSSSSGGSAEGEGQALPVVMVNEVSASNDIFQSERLKRSDWIELYNASDAPVDIAGAYISDDDHAMAGTGCRIPDDLGALTVIAPHGRLVIWADDVDMEDAPADGAWRGLHVPFKLANRPYCAVSIAAADGSWSNVLRYHTMAPDESVGRWPDGGAEVYRMDHPTIERENLMTSRAQRLTFDPLIVGIGQLSLQPSESTGTAPQSPDAPYDLLGRRVKGGARTGQGPVVVRHSLRLSPPSK